jgi:hypothetical protein
MTRIYFSFLTTFLLSCTSFFGFAQLQPSTPNTAALKVFQDSLQKSSGRMYTAGNNLARFDENAKFIKLLVTALKTSMSFDFGFDSLKTISVVKSPDNSFRIFSWYIPTEEGTYRFFGTLQMATKDGSLKLYPLIDDTQNFKDDNQIGTNKQWYGARYYEIVPLITAGKKNAYVLLGWKGNSNKTSKKVIEILSFTEGGLQFGKPVFKGPAAAPVKNRIVFEYNKLNSMTLRLDPQQQMIVFDHLAPFDPNMVGNFEFYASDSSFDGYRLVGDQLKLQENVELNNDPNTADQFYIDPKRKDIPVTKKF